MLVRNTSVRHGKWNGGRKMKGEYVLIKMPGHRFAYNNGYVPEHRVIYEQTNQCCLLEWVDIHHLNGIKNDNRPENLQAITVHDHRVITNLGRKWPMESRIRFSEMKKGTKLSEEHRQNIANSMKGCKWTEQQRENFSKSRKGLKKKPLTEEHKQKVREGMLRYFLTKKTIT